MEDEGFTKALLRAFGVAGRWRRRPILKSFHRGLHSANRPGLFKICPRIEIEHLGAKRSGREEVAIPQSGEKLWKIIQPAHDLVRRDWNRVINKYAVHCRSPRWWNRQASCQPVTPPSRFRLVAVKHCNVWKSPRQDTRGTCCDSNREACSAYLNG
jgi:hypothetical protein